MWLKTRHGRARYKPRRQQSDPRTLPFRCWLLRGDQFDRGWGDRLDWLLHAGHREDPILGEERPAVAGHGDVGRNAHPVRGEMCRQYVRSEEHTSELQSLA